MTNYDFLGKAKYFVPLSVVLIVISIVLVLTVGLRAGIDFTGGSQFTVYYPPNTVVANEDVRAYFARYEAEGIAPTDVTVTSTTLRDEERGLTLPGKIITIAVDYDQQRALVERIESELRAPPGDAEIPAPYQPPGGTAMIDTYKVGGQVAAELVNRAWQAILIAIGGILIYLSWRFRLRYAVGAIAALLHDVIIALGIFALFGVEISLPVIAAFLTIVGYSLNDTIVIYDRIRENLGASRKAPIFDVINRSVNQSLSRSINTSVSTLIPVTILYAFGGRALQAFALALLIGVLVGTYSSFFIANPVLHRWTLASEAAKGRKRTRR